MVKPLEIVNDVKKYRYLLKHHRRRKPISEIVIHHSWSKTLEKTMSTLIKKSYGTHYCIDRDGSIHQVCDESRRVAHCVAHNDQAIGIDLVRGPGQEILDCQYQSLNNLLVDICYRYDFKCPVLHENHIFYHRDLRPTECPGVIDDNKILY